MRPRAIHESPLQNKYMDLTNLIKLTSKSKKRIGRGHGSGRGGHTSTRGSKGQNARTSVSLIFEGTKLKKSFVKRLPLIRGKMKLQSYHLKTLILNFSDLQEFKENDRIDRDFLVKKGLITKKMKKNVPIKILSDGQISIPLTIALPCSKKAAEKIEHAGGKVIKE